MIKTELIDSKKYLPQIIIKDILNIIMYNNRFAQSYLKLAKHAIDDYNVTEVKNIESVSNVLFHKEYGIKLNTSDSFFEKIKFENLEIHTKKTIYRAIMYNDLESFIVFTERDGFDQNQTLKSSLYPQSFYGYSLLELCSYHGAVDCFKFLRTKFNSKVTDTCLELSFLGGNPEIMSECLKYQKPDFWCMKYAIISHNIDFVTFLVNEYDMKIYLRACVWHNNLETFLVYFDQTNDVDQCLIISTMFNIPSLCEYLLSHGANINKKDNNGCTALHYAACENSKEAVELLISHGANINEKDNYGETALHYAASNNSKEIVELLISHGANINAKDKDGETALHRAARINGEEIVDLLISHGAYQRKR